MKYKYGAIDSLGNYKVDVIDADSKESVDKTLTERELFVTSIEPYKESLLSKILNFFFRSKTA